MLNNQKFNTFCLNHRLEISIFLLALVVRIALFAINFQAAGSDLLTAIHGDDGYYEISQGLLSGHGFTGSVEEPFSPNPLRPPLWPAMIAGLVYIFGSYWAVAIFELIIASLVSVLGMKIASGLFDRKRLTVLVGIFLAIEPYGVFLSTNMYSETIFTFLFLAFFVFVIRYCKNASLRNAAWMAMFLGLSILAKATVQYFPFIIPFFMLYIGRNNLTKSVWRNIFVFVLIILALLGPWLYRNYREFGVWGMSAQPAFNLFVYLVPTALSIDNGTNFAVELDNFVYKKGIDVNSINLSNSDYYSSQALTVLQDHKLALVKSFGTTMVTFFTHDGMLSVLAHTGVTFPNNLSQPALSLLLNDPGKLVDIIAGYIASPAVLILVIRLVWICITSLFFIGIWKAWSKKEINLPALTALLIILYFALTTTINGLGVNARFRTPVNIFIFSFALYGLFSFGFVRKLKRNQEQ